MPRFWILPSVRCLALASSVAAGAPLSGCSGDAPADTDSLGRAVVQQYAKVVHSTYADTVAGVEMLQTKVEAFVADPSAQSLGEARKAWLAAREPYGQTEVFRFYEGPIDNEEDGPEPNINAWPLDEAYIDSVKGAPDSGIINDTQTYPKLSQELLAELNEKGSETNLSTGFHAIEFLLWGQDLDPKGPGNRPHTDYVTGPSGAKNAERRGQYLKLVTELLVADLQSVLDQWKPDAQNYRAEFTQLPVKEALTRILRGMGKLADGETGGERLSKPYINKDQEDEHSCFSDNTHRDFINNALGLQNVYLGRYGTHDGPGLDDFVKAKSPELNQKMITELERALTATRAIPAPFDQAFLGDDQQPGRIAIKAAIDSFKAQGEWVAQIGTQVLNTQIKTSLD